VADAHVPVVDDDREVVGRDAVGADDDEVVDLVVGDRDRSLDEVVPGTTPDCGLRKRVTGATPSGIGGNVLPGSGRQRPS
jgi:hypothetical protein